MTDVKSSLYAGAFIGGQFVRGTLSVFILSGIPSAYNVPAFLEGVTSVSSSKSAFLDTNTPASDSLEAYSAGGGGEVTSRIASFIGNSVVRSSVSVRFGGDGTGAIVAQRAYIELETSDASVKKRFRVLAQGYDDGSLSKAEKLDRTIGGGIDHSVGASYREWNMVIRVRHTEEDSNYGTLDELETFYELNDPGGTPSNDITLYDHHNMDYTVHLIGGFKKQLLGTMTEGISAWYIVGLKMVEV